MALITYCPLYLLILSKQTQSMTVIHILSQDAQHFLNQLFL